MRYIKLLLEYDGTDFCGWQIQPNVRTVQGEIENALSQLTHEDIRIHCAGRTDSGVHALGQVVHFGTESVFPVHVFKLGLNPLLPRDVRVVSASKVDKSFHARFSARYRVYQYRISKRVLAIGRQYAWSLTDDLDLQQMRQACRVIQGEHDFKSFCHAGADVDHYFCIISHADWSQTSDMYYFDITGNRFLHNMVRILVGTFVSIGRGDLTIDDLQQILEAKDRRLAGTTAPPQGLFLVKVGYELQDGV